MIKNPVKMVAVRCLILCSKFAKNRLSAGLLPDPLGERSLQRSSRPHSWIMDEVREGEMEGRRGRKGEGKKEKKGGKGEEGYPRPNE